MNYRGLLTINAYAKRRGVRVYTVQRAIKDGRVTTVKGPGGRPMIDPGRADREFDANTDPSKQNRKPKNFTGPKPAQDDGDGKKGIPSYSDSRAIREAYQARLAKIEYELKSGKLVDATEVRTAWLNIIGTARTKILSIASKAKATLPHLSLADIAELERLIREALEEISGD